MVKSEFKPPENSDILTEEATLCLFASSKDEVFRERLCIEHSKVWSCQIKAQAKFS